MNYYYYFSIYQYFDDYLLTFYNLMNKSRFILFHSFRLPRFFDDYKNYLYFCFSFFWIIFWYIPFHKNNLAVPPISCYSYSSWFGLSPDLSSPFISFWQSCSINSSYRSTISINLTCWVIKYFWKKKQ